MESCAFGYYTMVNSYTIFAVSKFPSGKFAFRPVIAAITVGRAIINSLSHKRQQGSPKIASGQHISKCRPAYIRELFSQVDSKLCPWGPQWTRRFLAGYAGPKINVRTGQKSEASRAGDVDVISRYYNAY